jgi:hypothetical protein
MDSVSEDALKSVNSLDYILYGTLLTGLFGCVVVVALVAPAQLQLLTYEEKILMLIARINLAECDREVRKYRLAINELQGPHD